MKCIIMWITHTQVSSSRKTRSLSDDVVHRGELGTSYGR